MKELPACAVIGCSNLADPRWYAHDPDGKPVMVCDGHLGTPCSGSPCTCPKTARTYFNELAAEDADLCEALEKIRPGIQAQAYGNRISMDLKAFFDMFVDLVGCGTETGRGMEAHRRLMGLRDNSDMSAEDAQRWAQWAQSLD